MASPYGNAPGYPPPGGYPPPMGGGGGGYPPSGPGYPPYPPGPPMQDNGPPPGYQYPPVPVPVGPQHFPVTQQPMHGQGDMGMPGGYGQSIPVNVPPGLEYLTTVDALYVKQKVEMLEALCGCETKNKYKIKNTQGQVIFTAKEDTDCCTRNCCGPNRPFDLIIRDASEREVIHLTRPLACNSCCFPCCLQSIEVFSPPGSLVGKIEQVWTLCSPEFVIKDASGNVVLTIEGPFCTYSFCGDVEFKILSKDGTTQVGKISKKWSGLLREAFTDADNFGINFPMDLDVRMKAVMLGACFLIDFMFFEKSQNQENDAVGMLG